MQGSAILFDDKNAFRASGYYAFAGAGICIVATRFLVQQNDPLVVALLRYSIAFVCLLPLLRKASPWPTPRDCAIILGLGSIVADFCPRLLTLSMQYTTASRGALILCAPVPFSHWPRLLFWL
jgi:drug/metabolite transporter (DMT)-like permease